MFEDSEASTSSATGGYSSAAFSSSAAGGEEKGESWYGKSWNYVVIGDLWKYIVSANILSMSVLETGLVWIHSLE